MLLAKLLHQRQNGSVWHIDATGSVVRAVTEKPIYYYVVVMTINDREIPALPLYEFLTDSHNVGNLTMAFVAWWGHMQAIGVLPKTIVLDMSWALIHSSLFAFCSENIDDHLKKLWRYLENPNCEMNGPCLRLCASHFIQAVSCRLAKIGVNKQVSQR